MAETSTTSTASWLAPPAARRWSLAAPALVHVLLAAVVLLGVTAINGRPAAFPDTAYYYSQGRYLAGLVGLSDPADAAAARGDPTAVVAVRRGAPAPSGANIVGARWPIYGGLLYAVHLIGSLWVLAALQCGLCAAMLWLLTRAALGRRSPPAFHGLVAALAVGTSLPLFASFAMPDIFAALTVVGAALLLVYWSRLSVVERAGVATLTGLSAALHPTHLILLGGVAAMAAAACAWRPIRPGLGPRAAVLAGLVAAAGLLAFSVQAGLNHSLGYPQGQPPFLTARLLADGPGRLELREACVSDRAPYALCRYRTLPLDDEEDIVWSKDPRRGVYALAGPDMQRRLGAEQMRFVVASVARSPGGVIAGVLRDWGRQLALFQVQEPLRNPADFLHHPDLVGTSIPRLIPDMQPCRLRGDACLARLPYGLMRWWHAVVLLLSVSFVGWRLSKPDARALFRDPHARGDSLRRLIAALALIAAVVLANAAVCGAIAGPFARYEARLIWLVPCGALLLAALIGWPPNAAKTMAGRRRG
jgi:hypothetical protein